MSEFENLFFCDEFGFVLNHQENHNKSPKNDLKFGNDLWCNDLWVSTVKIKLENQTRPTVRYTVYRILVVKNHSFTFSRELNNCAIRFKIYSSRICVKSAIENHLNNTLLFFVVCLALYLLQHNYPL